jgi:hypothetical protein
MRILVVVGGVDVEQYRGEIANIGRSRPYIGARAVGAHPNL